MDIWAWVARTREELAASGHTRLADLMEQLPGAVIADSAEEVEAMVPEALSLARALNLPWVELYVRHWHMQSCGGGFATLQDAIALLDFSHRDGNRECPQSVCTVQDVAIAYSGADGPGFAQERLDVSAETLERIDPSWPCFRCITFEHMRALLDAGRPEDALAFARGARAQIVAAGLRPGTAEDDDAEPLIALGRHEEALERLDAGERADHHGPDSRFARERDELRALALLGLGRAAEARERLVPLDRVLAEPSYGRRWAQAVEGLVEAGEQDNDWNTGAALQRVLDAELGRGRAWDGVGVAAAHARLALARGAPATAAHALAQGRELAAMLRDPSRGEAVLADLEAGLTEAAPPEIAAATPEALLRELAAREAPDAERDVELLAAAARRWPDDLGVVRALAHAADAVGRPAAGAAALLDFARRHPSSEEAWLAAGLGAIGTDDEQLQEALGHLGEKLRAWVLAVQAGERQDAAAAAEHAATVVALDPEALNARRLLAYAATDRRDYATALAQLDALLERVDPEDAEQLHWQRVTVATAAGDEAAARASAEAVGMDLEEPWGPVRLSFGPREIAFGERTGPAAARVTRIAPAGERQRAGTRVIVDLQRLDDDGEDAAPVLRVREIVEEPDVRAFGYDAIDPGEQAWIAFRDAVEAEGWLINSFLYRDDIEIAVDGERRRAIYGLIAVPEATDDGAAHARLTTLAAALPEAMIWPALARAAGDELAARAQLEVADATGLLPD